MNGRFSLVSDRTMAGAIPGTLLTSYSERFNRNQQRSTVILKHRMAVAKVLLRRKRRDRMAVVFLNPDKNCLLAKSSLLQN